MTVHQCYRFCNNPGLVQKRAVRRIAKYLVSTSTYVDLPDGYSRLSTCSVVYNTDKEKVIKLYLDADFAGGWNQTYANNAEIVCSVQDM